MSGAVQFRVIIPAEKKEETVLKNVLKELKVNNQHWTQGSEDGTKLNRKEVVFYLENGPKTEEALTLLTSNGIGIKGKSSIGVFPCNLHYEENDKPYIKIERCEGDEDEDVYSWERFVDSVRPRLAIAQVVQAVKYRTSLTFDFLILIVVAALTSAVGLIEDSPLILAASMLMSPLMGPVVAGMFGTVIRDRKLQKLGAVNGLTGLLLCLLLGFLFGLPASLLEGTTTVWPTTLMYSMGTVRSLWTAMIALLSGAALSVGLLGENPGSLQGVAISAALLPPAVNAGLLWSRSALLLVWTQAPAGTSSFWSSTPSLEYTILGGVSLFLSFLNIVFIYLAGILLLKVKEVAPWKKAVCSDWKHLREYKPLTLEETESLRVRFGENIFVQDEHYWTVMPPDLSRTQMGLGCGTWTAGEHYLQRPLAQDLANLMQPSIHKLSLSGGLQKTGLLTPSGHHSSTFLSPQLPAAPALTSRKSRFTVVPVRPTQLQQPTAHLPPF